MYVQPGKGTFFMSSMEMDINAIGPFHTTGDLNANRKLVVETSIDQVKKVKKSLAQSYLHTCRLFLDKS